MIEGYFKLYQKDQCLRVIFETHKFSNTKLPFKSANHISSSEQPFGGNWHEDPEIIQIVSGSGKIRVGGEETDTEVGDIFVVNPNEIHKLAGLPELRYNWLIIGKEFLEENGMSKTDFSVRHRIQDKAVTELFESSISRIKKAFDNGSSIDVLKARGSVLELITFLTENFGIFKREKEKFGFSGSIQRAIAYIYENFKKDINVDMVAKHVGLSRHHFMREFKKNTGLTVVSYINIMRCQYAKNLIEHTDNSIKNISELSGFRNFSYFSKVFKEMIGVSPSSVERYYKEN